MKAKKLSLILFIFLINIKTFIYSEIYGNVKLKTTDPITERVNGNGAFNITCAERNGECSLYKIDFIIDIPELTGLSDYFFGAANFITFIDVSEIKTIPTDTSGMFRGCINLEEIAGLSKLNTQKVVNMAEMFAGCTKLKSVDLSNLDTTSVVDMSGMFSGCESLETIDVSNLKTSKVSIMKNLFQGCKKLSSIDITNLDTSSVYDIQGMFSGCESLEKIDITKLKTSNVICMNDLFHDCKNLTSLDLTNLDISSVTQMYSMFSNCESLTSLDFSHLKGNKVWGMEYMFSGCKKLTSLNLSIFFSQENVRFWFSYMFNGCESLKTIELPTYVVRHMSTMIGLFNGCTSLISLDLSFIHMIYPNSMESLFTNCKSLISLDISRLNLNDEYAYILDSSTKLEYINIYNIPINKYKIYESLPNITEGNLTVCQREELIKGENVINKCCQYDIDNSRCLFYITVKYGAKTRYKNGFSKKDDGGDNIYRNDTEYIIIGNKKYTIKEDLTIDAGTEIKYIFLKKKLTLNIILIIIMTQM